MSSRRSRYEVLAKIASGGMATVYAGRVRGAVGFSRLVAIKRPHPFVTEDADLKQQLEAEARVASMIHHPNVVSVLDVEEIDGELVLVMDYVEGCTLKTLTDHAAAQEASFDRVAVRIILDVAAGLHAAHRLRDATGALLGVVHRDVSPQNVLLGVDGSARLTDFGIAKIMSSEVDPTATDIMKGKTAYLAPEYVTLRRFEARSDLFALAVVAWEALARQRLFKGASTVETLSNILAGRIPLLSSVRPELRALDDIIASALAREPADRPESVEAFAAALEASARATNGVATHSEVGALVEQVAGAAITARRQVLEAGVARALGELGAAYEPLSDRDRLETASLASVPPPSEGPTGGAATVTLRMSDVPGAPVSAAEPAPRRTRMTVAVVAIGALVAASAAIIMVNVARGAPRGVESSAVGGNASSTSATAPPPDPAGATENAASPLASDLVGGASTDAGSAPASLSGSSKHPRGPRVAPRGTTSALLPAHAPPNPYPH